MPAVTVEDIANMALDILVEAPIAGLDDNERPARLMLRHYETTRQAELTKHAWSFAIFRAELDAVDADALPVGDNDVYGYGYEVPEDALRILPLTDTGEAHGISIPWKREGGLILSNYEGPRLIRYIGNLTDPDDWDALFVEALAARLAMKVAMPLTGKAQLFQAAKLAYDEAIADAKRINAIESGSVAVAQSWAAARGDWSEMR